MLRGDVEGARELLQQAVAVSRAHGDLRGVSGQLRSLAIGYLREGRPAEARPLLEQALAATQEMGSRHFLASILEAFASLAIVEEDPRRAVRLLGAAAVQRTEAGAKRAPDETYSIEPFLQAAEAALTPEQFAQAEAEGAALTIEAALELARADSAAQEEWVQDNRTR
jgi:tetratricopeptide (TPR) repeat protein